MNLSLKYVQRKYITGNLIHKLFSKKKLFTCRSKIGLSCVSETTMNMLHGLLPDTCLQGSYTIKELKVNIYHCKTIGYNRNVIRQTACKVFHPVTVESYGCLFNYKKKLVGSLLRRRPPAKYFVKGIFLTLVWPDLSRFNWYFSHTQIINSCCSKQEPLSFQSHSYLFWFRYFSVTIKWLSKKRRYMNKRF